MSTRREQFSAVVTYQIDLWNAVEKRLRAVDGAVTIARHDVLALADAVDDCRVQDVSAGLHITVSAASRLVDRLESDGLLQRRPHPEDRRSSTILLTAAGKDALAITAPAMESALETILGDAGSARLAAIAEAIGSDERTEP